MPAPPLSAEDRGRDAEGAVPAPPLSAVDRGSATKAVSLGARPVGRPTREVFRPEHCRMNLRKTPRDERQAPRSKMRTPIFATTVGGVPPWVRLEFESIACPWQVV